MLSFTRIQRGYDCTFREYLIDNHWVPTPCVLQSERSELILLSCHCQPQPITYKKKIKKSSLPAFPANHLTLIIRKTPHLTKTQSSRRPHSPVFLVLPSHTGVLPNIWTTVNLQIGTTRWGLKASRNSLLSQRSLLSFVFSFFDLTFFSASVETSTQSERETASVTLRSSNLSGGNAKNPPKKQACIKGGEGMLSMDLMNKISTCHFYLEWRCSQFLLLLGKPPITFMTSFIY